MKKYAIGLIVFATAFIFLFPWSMLSSEQTLPTQWVFTGLLPTTILGALSLLAAFFIVKEFVFGQNVDSSVVPRPKDLQKAHQLVYAALGLFVVSTVSSVLPYMTEQIMAPLLGTFAVVCTLGGLFALRGLSKYQANMYWVRLKNAASLDERQLRERLSIMQKAYVASAVLLAAFLVLGALFIPNIIFGMIDCGGDSSLGTCKDFDWTPYINMMLVVLWMPSIVAALQLPQKATE